MKAIPTLGFVLTLSAAAVSQRVDPQAAWQQFLDQEGSGWTAEWNPATGTPQAIYGQGLKVAEQIRTTEAARLQANRILNRWPALLGRGDSQFVERDSSHVMHLYYFIYQQQYKGLEVLDARADVRVHDSGVIAMFGASAVQIPKTFDVDPKVKADTAQAVAKTHVFGDVAGKTEAPRLLIWAQPFAKAPAHPVLAWQVQVDDRPATMTVGKVYVDAMTQQVLEFRNEVYECAGCRKSHVRIRTPHQRRLMAARAKAASLRATPANANNRANITGKVMAWTNTGLSPLDALKNVPVANLLVTCPVGSAYTDASGNFSISYSGTSAQTVSATMTGRHTMRVRVAQGTQLSASKVITPGTPATIQFGSSSMPEFDWSQTTCYYMVNDANEWLRGLLPTKLTEMNRLSGINPRVNIALSCNASYSGYTINHYAQSSTCNMTAYSTVIYHEWGHGLDDTFGGIVRTDGLSEGWADVIAIIRTQQPIVGKDFRKSGGIVRTALNTKTYPQSGGVHIQGEVWMGWTWDVRTNLIPKMGTTLAQKRIEDIVIKSIVANSATMSQQIREVFLLDDDDGNLNNGTPNYTELEKACLKRTVPYPKKANPNAGAYSLFGVGCQGSGKLSTACRSANGTATAIGTLTQNSNIFAMGVPASTSQIQVTGFDLFCQRVGGTTPLVVNTQIYLADTAGKPTGSPVRTGTMTLTTTAGWYKTTFSSPLFVSASQKFFLSYTSRASQMKFPIVATGTNVEHYWHSSSATTWNGPFTTQKWGWRVNCGGSSSGAIPQMTNDGVPEITKSFKLELAGAKASSTGFLIVGVSDTTWNSIGLPWLLTPLGAKDCRLYCSLDVLLGINTSTTGTHTQTFAIPNLPAAVGAVFYNQYAIADNHNSFGIVLSNAGKGKVGKP